MTKQILWILIGFLCLFLLGACGSSGDAPGSGVFVWIDVPVSGVNYQMGETIMIEGHATSSKGIARVEIWVNGLLIQTLSNLSVNGDLAYFTYSWVPTDPGEYTILSVSIDSGGVTSEPDTTKIYVGEFVPTLVETVTPVVSVTPVYTEVVTETPTPVLGAVVQFWAEPPEIQAGACTNIRWHLENVQQVVFGGTEQLLDGSYQDCLCSTQRYTLIVTHLDGSQENRTLDVYVSGSCVTPTVQSATPTTPADTTPPPAPSPAVPQSGLTIACKASQTLAWLPVDDPSGIASYRVAVQRHSGDNNWQPVNGSPFDTGTKNINVPVECGWYYRWRVNARDGAGNIGPWSGWWQFAITLN